MAEAGVKEEEVFRQGPNAPGLQDAVFQVATRANDHLITAREMLKRLKAGEDPGHEFEHHGEDEHFYEEESDTIKEIRQGFGVLLEAIPAAQYLQRLEKADFDPIAQTVGSLVLKNGGVVRGLANWGVFSLPKPISVHQMKHTHGHYFVMRYDAASKVHQDVRNTLRLEPRMIRAAHVKLGDGKLETLARFGPPKWKTTGSEA
ncbi:hypothetical protein Neosp_007208 [[Neocosmospora] mangrovei]